MEQPANEHEIDRAVSDRLERDVNTVYRLRVASLRGIHPRILPSARLDRNTAGTRGWSGKDLRTSRGFIVHL
jgi:hypothetical protein